MSFRLETMYSMFQCNISANVDWSEPSDLTALRTAVHLIPAKRFQVDLFVYPTNTSHLVALHTLLCLHHFLHFARNGDFQKLQTTQSFSLEKNIYVYDFYYTTLRSSNDNTFSAALCSQPSYSVVLRSSARLQVSSANRPSMSSLSTACIQHCQSGCSPQPR